MWSKYCECLFLNSPSFGASGKLCFMSVPFPWFFTDILNAKYNLYHTTFSSYWQNGFPISYIDVKYLDNNNSNVYKSVIHVLNILLLMKESKTRDERFYRFTLLVRVCVRNFIFIFIINKSTSFNA